MNAIIFGILFSVLVVHGIEENCQELRQLESTCGNYCFRALNPVLHQTKALQSQVTDHQTEKRAGLEAMEKLMEAKFTSQDKEIEQKFEDLRIATESMLKQMKLQGDKAEQYVQDLHRFITVDVLVPGPSFRKIGSKYYYIELFEEVNWFEAVNKCLAMGAHLISIKNQTEFDAIRKNLPSYRDYWIDVNDLAKEGEFTSIATGTKASYLNWDENQPNHYDDNARCVTLGLKKGRKMNVYECSSEHKFICEYRQPLV